MNKILTRSFQEMRSSTLVFPALNLIVNFTPGNKEHKSFQRIGPKTFKPNNITDAELQGHVMEQKNLAILSAPEQVPFGLAVSQLGEFKS